MARPRGDYLFVDAAYLRRSLERVSEACFESLPIQLNPAGLTHGFAKTFYYDCPPVQRKNEAPDAFQARVRSWESERRSVVAESGTHFVSGTTSGTGSKTRQKKVDVAIAVDILTHTHRRNLDSVTLLTGDLDFKPVIDALVGDGMFVTLWFEPTSASRELFESADRRRVIDAQSVYTIADGECFQRFPQPHSVGTSKKLTERPPDATGALKSGWPLRLWKGEPAMFEIEDSPHHVIQVDHEDRAFLERYIRSVFGEFSLDQG